MATAQARGDKGGKTDDLRRGWRKALATIRRKWRASLGDTVDQHGILAKVDDDSGLTGRYVFMTLMAAGIAILGLLQSSAAVIIGAMLLSPLMGPIMAAGLALAVGDFNELKKALKTLAVGALLAVSFSALIVFLSPIQTVTSEIAARTRPNLFDLFIALFSGLAGAYAVIRGREGTIVGVAIATALMPPLSVVGFGLATGNWSVFSGALMLFFTNFMTIGLSAAVMARLYGFETSLTPDQTRLQGYAIFGTLLLLAIPLGWSLNNIAWEANSSRIAASVVESEFGPKARASKVDVNYDSDPLAITASVLTPEYRPDAEKDAQAKLTAQLGVPVTVAIDQYRVGTDANTQAAELNAARQKAQSEVRDAKVNELTNTIALIANVPPDEVLVDREHRRAMVRAQPIPGASLATYQALEARISAAAPGWTIELRPPTLPLPNVTFDRDGKPNAQELSLLTWAAERSDLAIQLSGGPKEVGLCKQALTSAGVQNVQTSGGRGSVVTTRWVTPELAAQ